MKNIERLEKINFFKMSSSIFLYNFFVIVRIEIVIYYLEIVIIIILIVIIKF